MYKGKRRRLSDLSFLCRLWPLLGPGLSLLLRIALFGQVGKQIAERLEFGPALWWVVLRYHRQNLAHFHAEVFELQEVGGLE